MHKFQLNRPGLCSSSSCLGVARLTLTNLTAFVWQIGAQIPALQKHKHASCLQAECWVQRKLLASVSSSPISRFLAEPTEFLQYSFLIHRHRSRAGHPPCLPSCPHSASEAAGRQGWRAGEKGQEASLPGFICPPIPHGSQRTWLRCTVPVPRASVAGSSGG